MMCPIHKKEMREGKYGPYCATKLDDGSWCKYKPEPDGWGKHREELAKKVAPEKATMTKEDWKAKEQRTNKNILLQVAYKAAVELAAAGKIEVIEIASYAVNDWQWLMVQLADKKPSSTPNFAPQRPSGDEPPINVYADDPQAQGEVDANNIPY